MSVRLYQCQKCMEVVASETEVVENHKWCGGQFKEIVEFTTRCFIPDEK